MGEKLNWVVVPTQNTVTTLVPAGGFDYDLINATILKRLQYGSREYGINLVWADPGQANASIRFRRASGASAPLRYGESIAVEVRNGGFVRYKEREYGINLSWSDSPVYEWQFRSGNPTSSDIIQAGATVGLFNTVANDFVFYDPRRYGINLKWLRDEGKFNDTPWYEEVGNFASGLASQAINILKELGNRLWPGSIIDFILTFFGIMLPKRIRLRVVILRNAAGEALLGDDGLSPATKQAQLQQIDDAIALARQVFKKQVNTRIRAAGGQLIQTLDYPAPYAALNVHCKGGAYKEDLYKEAGAYFRKHMARGGVLGYAAPITIFIVKDVEGKVGCSVGPLADYVTVDLQGMKGEAKRPEKRPTTLAHEVGHACGLPHPPNLTGLFNSANLMTPGSEDRGLILELVQRAIFRNSRHVTLL